MAHRNLRKVTLRDLVELVTDPEGAPGSLARPGVCRWDVLVFSDAEPLKSTFFGRSTEKNVDSTEKRSKYLLMLNELFRAIEEDNYRACFNEVGSVVCKTAFEFKLHQKTEKVLELKANNKDRIYFYQLNESESQTGRAILLLLAYHKKDQRTPKDVQVVCERQLRNLLS
jgi:hypothetical protein